jgi:hypothetical protein
MSVHPPIARGGTRARRMFAARAPPRAARAAARGARALTIAPPPPSLPPRLGFHDVRARDVAGRVALYAAVTSFSYFALSSLGAFEFIAKLAVPPSPALAVGAPAADASAAPAGASAAPAAAAPTAAPPAAAPPAAVPTAAPPVAAPPAAPPAAAPAAAAPPSLAAALGASVPPPPRARTWAAWAGLA